MFNTFDLDIDVLTFDLSKRGQNDSQSKTSTRIRIQHTRKPPDTNFLKMYPKTRTPIQIWVLCPVYIVGERNCRSIRDILMPSILPRHTTSTVGTHKCSKGCVLCREHFVECTSFASDQTGETFSIRDSMNCKSDGVIYLLSCVKCKYNQ